MDYLKQSDVQLRQCPGHGSLATSSVQRYQNLRDRGDVLAKVDRMSMAASLEVRCRVVRSRWIVTGLPSKWKLHVGTRKCLLRKLAERLGVPGLERPKQGFAMPLKHWWQGELKNPWFPILLEPKNFAARIFQSSGTHFSRKAS